MLEITFRADFTNKRPELNSLAEGLLGDDTYCTVDDAGPYPIEEIHIKEYKYDVDIRSGIRTPVTDGCYPVYFTYDNNEVKTIRREYGIGQFRQVFDFKIFLLINRN